MVIGNHVSGHSNFIFPCDHHIFHHISPLQKPRKFSLHACEKSWRWAYDVIKWLIRQKIVLNPFYIRNLSKKEKSLLPYKSWKMIRSGCILNHQLSFGIINDLLHERTGVMKFNSPRKNHISRGRCPRKKWFSLRDLIFISPSQSFNECIISIIRPVTRQTIVFSNCNT